MANIRAKDIKKLEEWNEKELRKLRITINNRISSLKSSGSPKALPENHPLFEKNEGDCQALLQKVLQAESQLKKS